ncbi:MAG: tetratricopeptide repeat protein [Bacteroidetes bacterium]|nr:tetratricopeptide repeat protein [Bacteroidota bacterium]MBU1114869.1 tetratricopeptide repeat protein [Bacteroidota bacterium]MBU1799835.1 tetratricopeptide repeat protein [Bacteroidota bacterium]
MIKRKKTYLSFIFFFAFFACNNMYSQDVARSAELKASAITQMNAKKYGEAIDLLNKYISSTPRDTEGYTLRGLCYENIEQYQNAVLDLRRALKLDTQNTTARAALARTETVWHQQLRKKILGHEREIAIDPANPVNYLQIGISYRWLEEWQNAEDWYDKYLARDDNASPDEIIRYTEILAKNNHIQKGEIILKKYVDRYPEDWRLWSKYGYFSLWLAKYKQAQNAFEKALGFKPFFKEAQDGLDIVTQKAYVTQNDPRSFEKEFPIDRYYRLLRKEPKNDDIRFKLVDELIKANRIEEAYQQLEILGTNHSDEPIYMEKWDYIVEYRQKIYNDEIEILKEAIEKNPTDRNSVLKLAEYYRLLEEYDEAITLLENYMQLVPDEKDPKLKFEYAHTLAWNRYFDDANVVLDELLKEYPDNLDYKLFRAQIAIWTETDIELADKYIKEVVIKRPDNIDVLIAQATLLIMSDDFEEAQTIIDKAKEIDPESNEVITIQSRLEFQIIRAEERKIYEILEEGQRVLKDKGCEEAIPYYEEYLQKAKPNNIVKREYGDVLFCAKHFEDALTVYNEILEDGYDYLTALERAKLYYEKDDSLKALESFKDLVKEEPKEYQPMLFLGDSYSKIGENDSALAVYDSLLTWDLDSMQIFLVEQRIGWIPPSGLKGILTSFPSNVGISPQGQFYFDNFSYQLSKIGGKVDLGVFKYLNIGVSFYRTNTSANWESLDSAKVHYVDSVSTNGFTGKRIFTSFKGNITVPFSQNLILSVGLGIVNTDGFLNQDETEVFLTYDNQKDFGAAIIYFKSDANLILYSPFLIDYETPLHTRMTASLLKVKGHYNHSSNFLVSSNFDYVNISDGNAGNIFELRLGYQFDEPFSAGYEYSYQNFRWKDDYIGGIYYSPQNYDTHAFWGDFYLEKKEKTKAKIGGKIGYSQQTSQLILEAHLNTKFKPLPNLIIESDLSLGQSSQFYFTYRYFSFNLAVSWSFW